MPRPLESLSVLESAVRELLTIADQIAVECGYIKSCVVDGQISSSTQSAESPGDTSAPQTTGQTDTWWTDVMVEMESAMERDGATEGYRIAMRESLARWCSSLDSAAYAAGGNASPALPSDAPRASWPGASSDPTRHAHSSAPMPAPTHTVWSGLVLTVVARLSGTLVQYYHLMTPLHEHIVQEALHYLRRSADPSHTSM